MIATEARKDQSKTDDRCGTYNAAQKAWFLAKRKHCTLHCTKRLINKVAPNPMFLQQTAILTSFGTESD